MGRIGLMELIVILAVVLLLFGPKKLPELAKGMGEAVREFRKGTKDLDDAINQPVFPENQKTETNNAPTVENAKKQNTEEEKKEEEEEN